MDLFYESTRITPLTNSTLLPLLLLSLANQRYTPVPSDTFKEEYDYIVVNGENRNKQEKDTESYRRWLRMDTESFLNLVKLVEPHVMKKDTRMRESIPAGERVALTLRHLATVGAGAAGCVVASRLSEKSCVSVLLLEAGDKPPPLTEVPGLARYFRKYKGNFRFKTVPQKYAAKGLKNRQIVWTTGKMLGGSGSINGMEYVRGNYRDYDNWATMGAKGWSYRDVFPYFLKLEDNRNPEYLANGYHATGGPITVEVPRYYSELKEAAYRAAAELGIEILDSNAEKQLGFYAVQGFIRDSQRCNSLKGYIVPAENRENLDILTNAFVTKVIIEDGKATGVEFRYKGKIHVVKARKEVVVSAGTENSPKILMLSGIGPKEELHKFNIPVVADLPVGKNLHDDAGTHYIFTLNERFRVHDDKISDPSNILQYIYYRTGPLAGIDSINIGFLRCVNESGPADYPDYELYFKELTASFATDLELKEEVYEQYLKPYAGQPLFSCTVHTLVPKSRGIIALNSSNPFDAPLIDPNYLQIPTDITDIVQGLRTCKKLLNTPALQELDAKPLEILVPGCEDYFGDDEKYFECFAKTLLFTFHHPVGTCKMGDPLDATTVVDPELRVKGIKGLRVVDASIMPVVTRGNTFIPTVMIAEKASDMIKSCITC